jgi:hypothetical protein
METNPITAVKFCLADRVDEKASDFVCRPLEAHVRVPSRSLPEQNVVRAEGLEPSWAV